MTDHTETYRAGVVIDPARAEANVAFELAIASGRLSRDRSAANYAGHYMFMGYDKSNRALFKDIMTRAYID